MSLVLAIGVETVSEHAGAVPVHSGSPPPLAVTVLELGSRAVNPSMVTGTVIAIDVRPIGAPAEMEHAAPKLVDPTAGAQVSVTPGVAGVTTMLTGPLIVMPVGNVSVNTTGAVVAFPATAMLILYDWPVAPATSGLWLAVLVTVSFVATTGVVTVPVHAGAVPVHNGSPPPAMVAVLVTEAAVDAATFTGTVMMMLPIAAPVAIVQPAKVLAPVIVGAAQVIAPPVAVGNALSVMPAGKMSDKVIGAVVALFATAIVMV